MGGLRQPPWTSPSLLFKLCVGYQARGDTGQRFQVARSITSGPGSGGWRSGNQTQKKSMRSIFLARPGAGVTQTDRNVSVPARSTLCMHVRKLYVQPVPANRRCMRTTRLPGSGLLLWLSAPAAATLGQHRAITCPGWVSLDSCAPPRQGQARAASPCRDTILATAGSALALDTLGVAQPSFHGGARRASARRPATAPTTLQPRQHSTSQEDRSNEHTQQAAA